jgi:uncharacterized SAM-binding protein YcdF (DUF218 family)
MDPQVYQDAALIWDYHHMGHGVRPADAIFCLCSLDIRVAHRAADLFLAGLAPLLIFSGNTGALTGDRFGRPEAEAFAAEARRRGVPASAILTEPRATNTGENVRFTHALLRDRGIVIKSFLLVQKPYMERRTYATFCKQWPDGEGSVEFAVTSPQVGFDDYPDDDNPRELVVSIMVGDLTRIRDYPSLGFQIPQDIPTEVWEARDRLIAAGYDKHLPR